MGIAREILLRASQSDWLADQLTRRRFARRAVERFMPGEDAEAALEASESLRQHGLTTILTLLGENVTSDTEVEGVTEHYVEVIDRVVQRRLDTDVSVKPTQFGIDLSFDLAREGIERVVRHAAEHSRMLAIDMESSDYTDRTIDLYRRLRGTHENITLCLQAYLYRTAADLKALLPASPRIRLVKGAYKEPASLAYRSKREVDENFLRLAETLLDAARDGAARVYFGTHDTRLIERICARADIRGVARDRFEFQMLYGIQRQAQLDLVERGFQTRVLISYGESWFPWFMRRLAERPANVLFVLRNLISGRVGNRRRTGYVEPTPST